MMLYMIKCKYKLWKTRLVPALRAGMLANLFSHPLTP